MTCCKCEREISTGLYTGPELSFDEADFQSVHLNSPRGTWGKTPPLNGYILHTFHVEIPEDCEIESGELTVNVSRLSSSGNWVNDELWITHNGGQLAQHEWIWGNNGNAGGDIANAALTQRAIVLELNADSLASVSGGSLSFLVEDDTAVISAELKIQACCTNPVAMLTPLNSCRKKEVKTEPWGIVSIPVYDELDEIIAHTKGTCGETGYYVSLYELNPVPWTVTTNVWGGWVCFNCKVPDLIDLSNYLPPQHRSSNGGFKPSTYYSFKLAVSEPWNEAFMTFLIA